MVRAALWSVTKIDAKQIRLNAAFAGNLASQVMQDRVRALAGSGVGSGTVVWAAELFWQTFEQRPCIF